MWHLAILQIGRYGTIIIVTKCNKSVIDMFFSLRNKKKVLLAGILTVALLLNTGNTIFNTSAKAVSQSELDALKQQQEELAEQRTEIQKKSDALNSEVDAQTEKLNLLTEQLDVTNSELENLSEQITIYTNSIAEMENELNEDRQKEQKLLVKYKERVRVMEENGNYTYIYVLFGATSFEDLLSRLDTIMEIMEYDNSLVDKVRDAEEKVTIAKADMESEIAAQKEIFTAYQEKQADLLSQQEEVEDVLSSLSSNSADYNEQLKTVETLQSSLTEQISDMQDKLAEQERLKAEQEAAQKLSPGNDTWYGDSEGTGTGEDIVEYAETFLGVPYVYGGTSPSGFDCSGLVYYCYKHFGYSVNRTAASLAYNGVAVSVSNLQPGDILLFTSSGSSYIGHTGIYIGNGQFIHAPHTGDVVKISSLSETYYKNHFWGARRIISG